MSGRVRRALHGATPGAKLAGGGVAILAPFAFGLLAGTGALVAYAGYRAVAMLSTVLVVIVAAGLLTVGEQRIVTMLRRRGVPDRLAVVTVVIGVFALAILAVALFVPFLAHQFEALADSFAGYVDRLRDTPAGHRLDEDYDLSTTLDQLFTPSRVQKILSGVFGGIGALIGFGAAAFTTAALTIYLLAGFERITQAAFRAVPATRRAEAIRIGQLVVDKLGSYIVGVVAVGACAGVSALIFMLIVGIPYAVVLALIIAAFDMIPQIGATLGALVVIVVGLSQSFGVAVAAAAFFIVYQQIENWIIYPRVMGQAVRVSGLAAVLSVLVGTAIAGVFGALVAVPAYAAVSIVVREVYLPRQDAR